MKPENLKTKIFLDGGDPAETKEILNTLGFLDGQTTNPTLVSKNPKAADRLKKGEKFTGEEIMDFYKSIVSEISSLIPDGSVSIEVYADKNTTAEEMLKQAKEMNSWIPNAHIKFPTISAGLKAAEECIKMGINVNMTLVFTQEQAAAVYSATKGASKGQVFVSPFIGRLDDRAENGMDLIKNIIRMYKEGDGHVEVLTASVRSVEHYQAALSLGTDIITAPGKLIIDWKDIGLVVPRQGSYAYNAKGLKTIEYKELDLERNWSEFDINHELTEAGIEKFAADWNALIK
jgi:transaldolase